MVIPYVTVTIFAKCFGLLPAVQCLLLAKFQRLLLVYKEISKLIYVHSILVEPPIYQRNGDDLQNIGAF